MDARKTQNEERKKRVERETEDFKDVELRVPQVGGPLNIWRSFYRQIVVIELSYSITCTCVLCVVSSTFGLPSICLAVVLPPLYYPEYCVLSLLCY